VALEVASFLSQHPKMDLAAFVVALLDTLGVEKLKK